MEVELRVDGEEVPLNEFVQKMLGSLIEAFLKSLHGVKEEWSEAEMTVRR